MFCHEGCIKFTESRVGVNAYLRRPKEKDEVLNLKDPLIVMRPDLENNIRKMSILMLPETGSGCACNSEVEKFEPRMVCLVYIF